MSQEGSILKKFTSAFGRLFLSAVLIFLVFYTMMPAINLHDQDFIVFLIICILIVLAVNFMESILILITLETVATCEKYAVAVNKDNRALTDAINDALDQMDKDGTLAELQKQVG